MCTSLIVGKDASVDGSVLLGANDDWPGSPGRICCQPARECGERETFLLVKGGQIPQVPRTRAHVYTAGGYSTGTRSESWIEGVNERQVAVSMQGVYAFRDLGGHGLLEADDLPRLVLERADTARGALGMIGDLLARHGFGTSSIPGAEGTVSMAVADPHEGWWLEVVPGGEWVAQRVPDDAVSCRVNCYGTHLVDLEDHANVLSSPGLVARARERGWFVGDGRCRIDFGASYGTRESICSYGAEQDAINTRRRWRLMSLAAGETLAEDEPVYQVRSGRKLSRVDVMDMLRDTYADTPYDLARTPSAGPFHNPFHAKPDSYSLSQAGTIVSMVANLRDWLPGPVGAVLWIALDNPATSVYTPWWAATQSVPECYGRGIAGEYDAASAWWAFQDLSDACCAVYDRAAVREVIPYWQSLERRYAEVQEAVERTAVELLERDEELAARYLTTISISLGLGAVDDARRLRSEIRGRYVDLSNVE